MFSYTILRGFLLLLGLALSSIVIFLSLRVLPGDVAQIIAGTQASPEQVLAIKEALGLNRPLLVQYADWAAGLLTGNLGNSLITGTSVADEILAKAQVTLPLGLMALLIGLIIALPLGVMAATLSSAKARNALTFTAQTFAAVPVVWAGMGLILIFSVWLGLLPAQGFPREGWANPLAAVRSLLLPALTIGVIEGALLMRFVRSATVQAQHEDFVRTAAAKGMTRLRALIFHGLPTVGLSIITVLGLQVAAIIVGAVVIEQLFSLPGIGRMLVSDVGNRDLIKVQSELMVLTATVLIIGFLVDLIHRGLDPRLRETAA